MNESIVRNIITYSKLAFDRYLSSALGGNTSVRDGDRIYITATNTCLGLLREEDVIVCDLDGNLIEGGQKPSKETDMHLQIYRSRPEVRSIMHLHPVHVVALSDIDVELDTQMTGPGRGKLFRVRNIPFAGTKTDALHQEIDTVLNEMAPEEQIFVIAQHGTVAFGPTLLACFAATDLAEDTAKQQWLCRR